MLRSVCCCRCCLGRFRLLASNVGVVQPVVLLLAHHLLDKAIWTTQLGDLVEECCFQEFEGPRSLASTGDKPQVGSVHVAYSTLGVFGVDSETQVECSYSGLAIDSRVACFGGALCGKRPMDLSHVGVVFRVLLSKCARDHLLDDIDGPGVPESPENVSVLVHEKIEQLFGHIPVGGVTLFGHVGVDGVPHPFMQSAWILIAYVDGEAFRCHRFER